MTKHRGVRSARQARLEVLGSEFEVLGFRSFELSHTSLVSNSELSTQNSELASFLPSRVSRGLSFVVCSCCLEAYLKTF